MIIISKHYTDRTAESPLCRMCGKRGERPWVTLWVSVKGWLKGNIKDSTIFGKDGMNGMNKYQVVENDEVKLLWDKNIQCDIYVIEARRPDFYRSE